MPESATVPSTTLDIEAVLNQYVLNKCQKQGQTVSPALPQSPTHHTIHRQQLVPTLEASMAVSHASRNDTGDVDGRVLLLAPHDIKPQALVRLGQLHYPGMCMALTGREGSHCGLGERKCWEVRAPPWWTCGLGVEDLGQGEQLRPNTFPQT